jgi:hypothetical protein
VFNLLVLPSVACDRMRPMYTMSLLFSVSRLGVVLFSLLGVSSYVTSFIGSLCAFCSCLCLLLFVFVVMNVLLSELLVLFVVLFVVSDVSNVQSDNACSDMSLLSLLWLLSDEVVCVFSCVGLVSFWFSSLLCFLFFFIFASSSFILVPCSIVACSASPMVMVALVFFFSLRSRLSFVRIALSFFSRALLDLRFDSFLAVVAVLVFFECCFLFRGGFFVVVHVALRHCLVAFFFCLRF